MTPVISISHKFYRNNFFLSYFLSAIFFCFLFCFPLFPSSMASSREWASYISSIASFMYFLLIIFQIPLFRVPCRFGMCKTPIEVTSSQLIASELFPAYAVKVLLYPGAIATAIIKNRPFPSYSKLLKLYNITSLRKAPAASDIQRLEILAGSYLSVVGAFICLLRHGRMSLFGMMLIAWGFLRELILGQFYSMVPTKATHLYPTMIVAMVCAFLSIRSDVRKLIHSSKARRAKFF
ncbi:uncharacterized protein LOC111278837 isoform X1 [Durio zibethinus]|uniref:Uncharacterized protein LOC111278837 isoform X1 n=1 Tax=Durio zibethinus TaxID=66656 RepID=A0A6P5WZ79_DURZI|nr:uncharacterized protein LOC111278837 isoform X1 [Durio zibethinus]